MNDNHVDRRISREIAIEVGRTKRVAFAWTCGMIFFFVQLQVFVWFEKSLPPATVSGALVMFMFAGLAIALFHSILVGGRELIRFLIGLAGVIALMGILFVFNQDLLTGNVSLEGLRFSQAR